MALPDKTQRLILYNQYEILKLIDPDNKERYAETQEVIAGGFETAYEWTIDFLSDPISKNVSTSVLNALQVCEALAISQRNGEFKSAKMFSNFEGYDGNHETNYMAFAQFILKTQGKFSDLAERPVNSHMAAASKYDRMYNEWRSMDSRFDLSLTEVDLIANA